MACTGIGLQLLSANSSLSVYLLMISLHISGQHGDLAPPVQPGQGHAGFSSFSLPFAHPDNACRTCQR